MRDPRRMGSGKRSPAGSGRAALLVWLQLLGLLGAVGLFGWIILKLTLSIHR
jgi:hypothetical protein